MAAQLYNDLEPKSAYYDRHSSLSRDEYADILKVSTTLYVGNLSFYTSEGQLLDLFGACGKVRNFVMGLNKNEKTPCGFCFVEFYLREDAARAVDLLN